MKCFCLFLFLAAILCITSCSHSPVSKKLAGSDSLVVNFYAPGTDSAAKTFNTTDKNAIRKLIQFVDKKPSEQFKCGYDGNFIFYANDKAVLPVVFQYKNKECRHFVFELDGQLMSTRLNNEAFDFLESLEAGRSWY